MEYRWLKEVEQVKQELIVSIEKLERAVRDVKFLLEKRPSLENALVFAEGFEMPMGGRKGITFLEAEIQWRKSLLTYLESKVTPALSQAA